MSTVPEPELDLDQLRVDRGVVSVGRLSDHRPGWMDWMTRSPEERLAAVELLRRINYGDDACTGRLQRVLEVARFTQD